MKQFKLNDEDIISPSEYTKHSVKIAVAYGNVYILNDWLAQFAILGDSIRAIAYSLYSDEVWDYSDTLENLIIKLLVDGYEVYQFDTPMDFINWLKRNKR